MRNDSLHIISINKCLSEMQLFAFIEKQLQEKDLQRAEKHIADCPFCQDAIEGYKLMPSSILASKRIAQITADVEVITQNRKGRKYLRFSSIKGYGIAIMLVVFVGVAIIFYMQFEQLSKVDRIAINKQTISQINDSSIIFSNEQLVQSETESLSVSKNKVANTESNKTENIAIEKQIEVYGQLDEEQNKLLINQPIQKAVESEKVSADYKKDNVTNAQEINEDVLEGTKTININDKSTSNGYILNKEVTENDELKFEDKNKNLGSVDYNNAEISSDKYDTNVAFSNAPGITIYYFAEVAPQFKEGSEALNQYISDHLTYTKNEYISPETIYTQFVINEDGSISDIKVTKGENEIYKNAAIKLISNMPNWIPASNNGIPIKILYVLPIRF